MSTKTLSKSFRRQATQRHTCSRRLSDGGEIGRHTQDHGKPAAAIGGRRNTGPKCCGEQDGSRIASGSNDHKVRVWDSDSGALLHAIDVGGEGPVWSVAFSPTGDRIATGNDDGVLQVWSADGGQKLSPAMKHGGPVNSIAFSRDGRFIATGGADGTVLSGSSIGHRMDAYTSIRERTLVRSVAFSPRADLLVAGGTISPFGCLTLRAASRSATLWSDRRR